MVVKLAVADKYNAARFESRVILDGSQTVCVSHPMVSRFESRVILDGSQTWSQDTTTLTRFESRVILDGSQTGVTRASYDK